MQKTPRFQLSLQKMPPRREDGCAVPLEYGDGFVRDDELSPGLRRLFARMTQPIGGAGGEWFWPVSELGGWL